MNHPFLAYQTPALGEIWEMIKGFEPTETDQYQSIPKP